MGRKEDNEQRRTAIWRDDPIRVAPYVPTAPETVTAMLEMAEAGDEDLLTDLGCGDGRMLFEAATAFNVRQAIGYDIDPELCRQVNEHASELGLGESVKAINQDLFDADLSEASLVTLYLTTAGNERLKPKLEKETRPGTRIVSHDFTLRDWIPERVVTKDPEALNPHRLYLYRNPQSFPRPKPHPLVKLMQGLRRRLLEPALKSYE